jgi:phenylalanyl-tRNA synthetase beta chain
VYASQLLTELAGARFTGATDAHDGLPDRPVTRLRPKRTESLVGLTIPWAEQRHALERLGFDVTDDWTVTVPTWRARDVTREIDLVEEVARAVLDRVPHTMPLRRSVAGHLTPAQRFRRALEDVLVGAGFSEAYTWSLVARDEHPAALRLPEPLSAEHALLRTTLVEGLVGAARHNVDAGNADIALFEIARVYLPPAAGAPETVEGRLPDERWHVGAIAEGGYRAAKGAVETIYAALGVELVVERRPQAWLHPGKAAGLEAGWLGELHPTMLEGSWGMFELDLATLFAGVPERTIYEDVISFPAVRQDLAFVVDEDVLAGELLAAARGAAGHDLSEVEVFDVYRGDPIPDGKKSVAIRVAFQAADRTLSDEDARVLRERIVAALAERFGATLRTTGETGFPP